MTTELVNRQPQWFKPVFYGLMIVSVFFVIVIILAFPRVFRSGHEGGYDLTQAASNARQIGLALSEFEREYGAFPNDSTRVLVEKEKGTAIDLSGTSSNAIFRQLFAADMTESEDMFYARIKGSKRPDRDVTPGHILEPGECSFSYIAGLSSTVDSTTPLVLYPLVPGTTAFDPKPFDGKAFVLRIDNSVRTYKIGKNGHIYDKAGIDLLSPKNPIWKGKAPDIRYRE